MPILRGTRSVPCLSNNNNKLFSPALFQPFLWLSASASSPRTDGALGLASASSQYMSLGASPITAPPFTISVWVNPADRSSTYGIWGITDSNVDVTVAYAKIFTNGKVGISFNDGTNSINTAGVIGDSGSFTNFLITYDGTTLNIYLGGALDANSGSLVSGLGTLANTIFGAVNGGPTLSLNGSLAYPCAWNRQLTAGEVALLQTTNPNQFAGTTLANGLLFALPFTQPGTLTYDVIGTNTWTNHGGTAAAGPFTGPCTVLNESVEAQLDLSGNGLNVTQATVGNRPTYNPTGWNGLPCIAFSAAGSQSLQINPRPAKLSPGASPFTVGCWFNFNGTNRPLMSVWDNGKLEWLLYISGMKPTFFASTNGSTFTSIANGANVSTGAWHFVLGWWDGANLNIQVDNGTVATTAFAGPLNQSTSRFAIGYEAVDGFYMDGLIGSKYFFPYVLSASQIAQLYAYQR